MNTHPSAIFKHCSRCGSSNISYRDDDALHCESCSFRYYINSAAAVACLITNDRGELLLARRGQEPGKGLFDLPGGFVDIGESAENAVRRELKEELGAMVEKVQYLASYPNEYIYSGLTVHTLDMAFRCEVAETFGLKPADDVVEIQFFAPQDIPTEEIAFHSIRTIILDFIKEN